jgi:uncharacterized protein YgbK (DUF1537 family)
METAAAREWPFSLSGLRGARSSSVVEILHAQVDRPLTRVASPGRRADAAGTRGEAREGPAHARGLIRELRRLTGTVAVADARTDADLDALVDAALEIEPSPLLVGSAGLGGALARRLGLLAEPTTVPAGQWLILVGSLHPASRLQAERARRAGIRVLATPEERPGVPGDERTTSADVAAQLAEEAVRLLARRPAEPHALPSTTDQPPPIPVVVGVTGGATALAFYRALDAERIDLVGAPAPGLALGRVQPRRRGTPVGLAAQDGGAPRSSAGPPSTDRAIWLLTKAGGFGAPDLFVSLSLQAVA